MIVSKRDVKKALREIDRVGIYKRNRSKNYCLVEKRHYPPKCVLHLAYFYATGKRLKKLWGGPQTNNPLRKAGFTILRNCHCGNTCKIY